MSDESVKDQLVCAFLDGELSSRQVDELLEQLECEDTRSKACRQAMMGSLINQQNRLCVDVSLAVREAIRQEAPLAAPAARPASRVVRLMRSGAGRRWRGAALQRWQVPAAGLALAASAALAAVIVVQPEVQAPDAASPMVAANAPVESSQSPAASTFVAAQRPAARTQQLPAQLVATATASRAAKNVASPRELVIAAPQEQRPIVAQWSHAQGADSSAQQAAAQARMQERLNTYLISHARSGGGYALSGSLGYARVAARPQQTAANE